MCVQSVTMYARQCVVWVVTALAGRLVAAVRRSMGRMCLAGSPLEVPPPAHLEMGHRNGVGLA